MQRHIRLYVGSIASLALLWGGALYLRSAPTTGKVLSDALLLCCLAVAAELLRYLLPRSATGTIAFIPYLAAAIIIPGWQSVLSVVIVKTASEILTRRAVLKATLNTASHTVAELIAISVYLALGGVGLRTFADVTDLAQVTRANGIPALVAFALAILANNLIVHAAIGLSSGRPVRALIHENQRATLGLDFLAAPLIFVFAWVYAAFGPIAAAALWVPILSFRQVHSTNLELEQTNEELLELMVKSIEARDPYTSGHSRRVQQFSLVIARAIGLSDHHIEQIGRAALLHDVGKIYEKYAKVLAKQDKLSAEEWAIIKDHPVDGANLVATMTRLRDLVPPVRHHHENWDGTGYPDRIAGDAIPLAARIIRFADTIDAMTTERPYRRPLTEAQVRSEVVRCRGTQFDPQMADRLLASPLWATLFAPDSNERSIARLAMVGSTRPARSTAAKLMRGA